MFVSCECECLCSFVLAGVRVRHARTHARTRSLARMLSRAHTQTLVHRHADLKYETRGNLASRSSRRDVMLGGSEGGRDGGREDGSVAPLDSADATCVCVCVCACA